MSLHNVKTSGNYILATDNDGVAISEIVTQELVDNDFVAVKGIRSISKLNNISSATSSADTLITSNPLVIGSKIVIRKNDGTYHEMTIDATTPVTNAGVIPQMFSTSLPSGTSSSSYDSPGSWKFFTSLGEIRTFATSGGGYLTYRFENDELVECSQYYINMNSSTSGWSLQGSTNGLDWFTLHTTSESSGNGIYAITQNQAPYSRYRIYSSTSYANARRFDLLGDGVSVDTSAITAGETPDQVFVIDDTISYNNQSTTKNFVKYEYLTTPPRLLTWSHYNNITIPDDGSGDGDGSRTITTKVELKAAGNLITELTCDLWEALTPPVIFSVTKATAVGNAVTVYFDRDIDTAGDLLTSISISINSGGAITPTSVESNTNFIIIYYPAGTIVAGDTIDFIYDDTQTGNILESGTSTELISVTYPAINSLG